MSIRKFGHQIVGSHKQIKHFFLYILCNVPLYIITVLHALAMGLINLKYNILILIY